MPVKRRVEKGRRAEITDVAHAFLLDKPVPEDAGFTGWIYQFHPEGGPNFAGPSLQELWQQHRDELLAEWIAANPGTRPSCWWRWDAPEPKPENEPPAAYLDRLRLLLPGERQRLDAADFAPVAVDVGEDA